MKIKMDKAKINLNLNKLINEIDIIVENKEQNNSKNANKTASNFLNTSNSDNKNSLANQLLGQATNPSSKVRGANSKNNSHVIEILGATSLAMLAFAVLKRKDIEKLLVSKESNDSNYNYINVNTKNQKCIINNYDVQEFKVIIKSIEGVFYDFENLKNFDIEEVEEIIFVEIKNENQYIKEIRTLKTNWNKESTNKYINLF